MLKKILIGIVLFIVIILVGFLLVVKIDASKSKNNLENFKNNIQEIEEKEVSYVIVEINPKAILEVVNGKVVSKGCMNNDCLTIFKEIDILNNDIKSALEKMYNTAKEKGINVENGVKVSSSNKKVEDYIKDISYVEYKNITLEEEKEEIKKVLDNNEIKEETKKDNYKEQLLKTYQNDYDHGKLYECKMIDNEVACFITEDFDKELSKDLETEFDLYGMHKTAESFERLLKKFNIKYNYKKTYTFNNVTEIYINNEVYRIGSNMISVSVTIGIDTEATEKRNEYKNTAICIAKGDKTYILPITKINLLTLEYNDSDLIEFDWYNG